MFRPEAAIFRLGFGSFKRLKNNDFSVNAKKIKNTDNYLLTA